MEETFIDEKTKTFLIACLVTGIDVSYDKTEFMVGLVNHMNSTDRIYWAEGDQDGVIIHDNKDQPLLYVIYNNNRLVFRVFEGDEMTAIDAKQLTGFALLHVINYITSLDLEFCPSILGSESRTVRNMANVSDDTSDTNNEDWVL